MKVSASYRVMFLFLVAALWTALPTGPSYAQYGQAEGGFAGIDDPRQAELERPDARQQELEQGDARQQELERGDLRQRNLEEPSQRQNELEMGDQRQYELEH